MREHPRGLSQDSLPAGDHNRSGCRRGDSSSVSPPASGVVSLRDGFRLSGRSKRSRRFARRGSPVVPYAMAFIDMRMPPGWDGVETVEQLWLEDPRLQIVFCTAYSDYSWAEVLTRLDVRDRLLILKKPFDAIEVYQFANALTTKWQMTEQAAFKMSSARGSGRGAHAGAVQRQHHRAEQPRDPLPAARRAFVPADLCLAQHHQTGSRPASTCWLRPAGRKA